MSYDTNFADSGSASSSVKFYTNSIHYMNAKIATFMLAVSFKINKTNEVCSLEMLSDVSKG